MRHLYLVIIFFATHGVGVAQYIPTAVERAGWVVIDSDLEYSQGYYAFLRVISGDTIVGQRTYKKMYEHRIVYWPEERVPALASPYEVLPERRLIGMLRDDTTAQRVYGILYRDRGGNEVISTDTLLQDYSLEVGDTLKGYHFDTMNGGPVVTEVLYEEHFGRLRKVIKYYDQPFIEGVGSTEYGPTSGGSVYGTNIENHLLVDFCIGDFGECKLWLTPVLEFSKGVEIKIAPNPFSHTLHFTVTKPFSNPISVHLLSALGEVISRTQLTERATILTKNLPSGIYFVEFTHAGKRTLKKVIKQ